MKRLRTLRQSEQGQDLVEYALIAGFLAVLAAAALPGAAAAIQHIFSAISSDLTSLSGGTAGS